MTTCNGYVSRDFYNLELRHHQMLNIAFIVFESNFVLIYGCKFTLFILICKHFATFFACLVEKLLKNLHFIQKIPIFVP